VFLGGCPTRCLYCQNPDTWHKRDGRIMELGELERLMRRYHPFISCAGGGVHRVGR
jgi:pyruvate formate lyase activating enzyme